MLTNKDITFPYYSGNIKFSKCLGFVSIDSYLNSIRNPTMRTKLLLHNIREATSQGDMKRKRRLKHELYSFTPTSVIPKGMKRRYDNVHSLNPLMQIDLDGIEDEYTCKQLKDLIFSNHKQIICSMVSPSKRGVKCIMRITKPKSIDHYKAIHKAMVKEFECYNYLDEATNNAVLPLFLGADPDVLCRDFSECSAFDLEDWSRPEYVKLNDCPTHKLQEISKYTKLVENVLKKRFRDIHDNGHPQLRSASLILGSRISAGYIDEQEAIDLLTSLIKNNSYFHKGLNGYIETAIWAVKQGMKNT